VVPVLLLAILDGHGQFSVSCGPSRPFAPLVLVVPFVMMVFKVFTSLVVPV